MSADLTALRSRLAARARALGFARMGVAAIEPLDREARALRRWLARGHHGTMTWMAETAEVRLDPAHPSMLAGATRVIALATPYARAEPPARAGGIRTRFHRSHGSRRQPAPERFALAACRLSPFPLI